MFKLLAVVSLFVVNYSAVFSMLFLSHDGQTTVLAKCSTEVIVVASDGAGHFGSVVAIDGNNALIGAWYDDDLGLKSGSAYIFSEVSPGTWVQVTKLLASDGAASDRFGYAVAIDGNNALCGAYYDDDLGSAYIFSEVSPGTWVQVAKLVASDGAEYARFGNSVAIDGNNALCGAYGDNDLGGNSGAAYLFSEVSPGTWVQVAKLVASDGDGGDEFGSSVAIEGTNALCGAYSDDDLGAYSGSAYIFSEVSPGTWVQVAKLVASDGAYDDRFGHSVAISGTNALIGAPWDNDLGGNSGSAYIFSEVSPGTWVQVAKLVASDGAASDYFGQSVAIDGTNALMGAPYDSSDNSGSAYVFSEVSPGNWVEVDQLLASDGDGGDQFGVSVALSNKTLLVGANGVEAAYFFSSDGACVSCLNEGVCTNLGDICAVLFECDCTGTNHIGTTCDVPCLNGGVDSETGTVCDCTGTDHIGTACDVPCLNGGVDSETDTVCDCTGTDHIGTTCDVPCLNGGVDSGTGTVCDCTGTDYIGTACDVPCLNGGVNFNGSHVQCDCNGLQFTGARCEKSCNNGFNNAAPGARSCNCTLSGATGKFCTNDVDDCLSNPCSNGGTCSDFGQYLFPSRNNEFNCSCAADYFGLTCSDTLCYSSPCLNNGTCDNGNDVACNCTGTDYEGIFCETKVDECMSTPCLHGGKCIDLLENFSCNCTGTGFVGTICSIDADDCLSSPCANNGNCTDKGTNRFKCDCPLGLQGQTCLEDVNDCLSTPCENGGICNDTGLNEFSCTCLSGFNGTLCSEEVHACEVNNQCKHGGICRDEDIPPFEFLHCDCNEADVWSGVYCNESCTLGSLYLRHDGVNTCACNGTGGSGIFCEIDLDDCASNPCQSQGSCHDTGPNMFECDCPWGLAGHTCDLQCQHDTERDNMHENRTCDCANSGYEGDACENDVDECSLYGQSCGIGDFGTVECSECTELNCYQCNGQYSSERLCNPAEACALRKVWNASSQTFVNESICTSRYREGPEDDPTIAPTCSICAPRHFREGRFCTRCPVDKTLTIIFFVLLLILLIGLILYVTKFGSVSIRFAGLALNFIQMSELAFAIDLQWPESVKQMRRFMSPFLFNFDNVGGSSCLTAMGETEAYAANLLLIICLPLFIALAAWLTMLIRLHLIPKFRQSTISFEILQHTTRAEAIRQVSMFLNMAYLPLISKIWSHFTCVPPDVDDGSGSDLVLASNLEISCKSSIWYILAAIAGVSNILYGIGIPMLMLNILATKPKYKVIQPFSWVQYTISLYARMVFPDEKKIFLSSNQLEYELTSIRWLNKYGSWTMLYRYDAYYWGLTILIRGFCLTTLPGVFRLTEDPVSHALFLFVVTSFALALHIRSSPYMSQTLNHFESVAMFTNAVTIICGVITSYQQEIYLESRSFSVGRESSAVVNQVGLFVICIFALTIGAAFVMALRASQDKLESAPLRERMRKNTRPIITLTESVLSVDDARNDTLIYDLSRSSQVYLEAQRKCDEQLRLAAQCSTIDECKETLKNDSQVCCLGQYGSSAVIDQQPIINCHHIAELFKLLGNGSITSVASDPRIQQYVETHANAWPGMVSDLECLSLRLQLFATYQNSQMSSRHFNMIVFIGSWAMLFTLFLSWNGVDETINDTVDLIILIVVSAAIAVVFVQCWILNAVKSVAKNMISLQDVVNASLQSVTVCFVWTSSIGFCISNANVLSFLGARKPILYFSCSRLEIVVESTEESKYEEESKHPDHLQMNVPKPRLSLAPISNKKKKKKKRKKKKKKTSMKFVSFDGEVVRQSNIDSASDDQLVAVLDSDSG